MTDTNLIEIFCIFDDFCKYFTPEREFDIRIFSNILSIRHLEI